MTIKIEVERKYKIADVQENGSYVGAVWVRLVGDHLRIEDYHGGTVEIPNELLPKILNVIEGLLAAARQKEPA